jgi:large subunit ribosomal protein L21
MFDMEKYVVIKLGSKQYLVQEGDVIKLERQKQPLKIDVLLYSEGGKVEIGEPELNVVTVKATVTEEKLDKKIRVGRFKKKSGYEKVKGHRQPISIVKIGKITHGIVKPEDATPDNRRPYQKSVKVAEPAKKEAKKVTKKLKEKK